jgi:copper(I)-binding protein
LLSAGALGTAVLISGCGAGQISQTANIQPAVPGANSTVAPGADNAIQLRNAILAYPGVDGYHQGATAQLLLHIFNNGQRPVTLVQVTTDLATTVTMQGAPSGASPSALPIESASASGSPSASPSQSPSAEPSASASESPSGGASASSSASASAGEPVRITVPVGGFVNLSTATGQTLQLNGLTRSIGAGESTRVKFVFDNGAEYSLDVPVGVPSTPAPRGSAVTDEGGGE